MAYTVDILYTKNEDFSNPSTVTESGQPNSVDLGNLDSFEVYYTKAVLKNDGVVVDESTLESFQTLPAGTITLTHQSSVRSGSNYIVTYTYTSTYALSSSVLTCGVSISSQGVIAGNTITFTVSGLVPGDAYISQITTIDIYGESAQTSITLIMPVVNEVSIVGTAAAATAVECELDYTIDGGFYQGWVDYWDENADPSTDIPLGHNTFTNGADTCTLTNLNPSTSYKFRATIEYNNGSNSVVSSVVTARTAADLMDYLTITNTSGSTGNFYAVVNGGQATTNLSYSTDGGTTWNSYDLNNPANVPVAAGSNIKLRGTNGNGLGTSPFVSFSVNLRMDVPHTLSGNPCSLQNPDPAVFSVRTYTTNDEFGNLFSGDTYLTDASGLATSQLTEIYPYGFYNTFNDCTNLQYPPDLSGVTLSRREGLQWTFKNCTSLRRVPDMSNIDTLFSTTLYVFYETFKGCSLIETGLDLRNLSTISGSGGEFYGMYDGCVRLNVAYAPDITDWANIDTTNWLNNVAASGTLYVPNSTLMTAIPDNDTAGCPSGWTKQLIS